MYPAFQAEITFNVGPWDPSGLFYNPRNEIRSKPDKKYYDIPYCHPILQAVIILVAMVGKKNTHST